jgi:GNAT superfamily N-acetyltransferase
MNIKNIHIRFIQQNDVKELVELCELHAIFEKATYNPNLKAEKLNAHLFSDNPSLYCLVVEKEGKLLGYASFMKQFSTWDAEFYIYMDCLFLREDARGFNLGEQLMNRIKEEGKKLNCHLVQWQTPKFNERAMKFYDRIGGVSKTKERYFWNI